MANRGSDSITCNNDFLVIHWVKCLEKTMEISLSTNDGKLSCINSVLSVSLTCIFFIVEFLKVIASRYGCFKELNVLVNKIRVYRNVSSHKTRLFGDCVMF